MLLEAQIPNELVAEAVARDPRRRFGIAGIDPMSPDALDEIDKAIGLGLVGVTVSPMCQGFHPTHSAALRIYEHCNQHGLPLFISPLGLATAQTMMDFGRPVAWDEVARDFETLTIVVGGLGFPWVDECLMLIGKHPRVFADISGIACRPWNLFSTLQTAASLGVLDKLLFGSGFPFETPTRAIESIYSVNTFSHGTQIPSLPRAALRGVVERQTFASLGIECIVPARADTDWDVPSRIHTGAVIARAERDG